MDQYVDGKEKRSETNSIDEHCEEGRIVERHIGSISASASTFLKRWRTASESRLGAS